MAQTVELLNKRYRIRQQIGRGGFGAVYLADDTRLPGRQVAIKENLITSREAQQQFQREAVLLARLRHPNLPQVTDYFIDPSGKQYLVMDYVPGDNLRQLMTRQGGRLAVDEALAIIEQIMQALAAMHAWRDPDSGRIKPIIHRDIKPENIKRTPDGRIVLVDFGIAKVQSDTVTALSARALTPGYAPLEQYHGGTDQRSDIYSLGATLYVLLTGRVPPSATSLAAGAPLPPPRSFNQEIPAHYARVIERALELKAADRYQSIGEMYEALYNRPLQAGTKTKSTHRPAPDDNGRDTAQRSPLLAAGLLIAAFAMMVIGWFVLSSTPPATPAATFTPIPVETVIHATGVALASLTPSTPEPSTPTDTPEPTQTATPTATDTPVPTETESPTSTDTPTPDADATREIVEAQIRAAADATRAFLLAVEATLTASAPTATATPRPTYTATPRPPDTPTPQPPPTSVPPSPTPTEPPPVYPTATESPPTPPPTEAPPSIVEPFDYSDPLSVDLQVRTRSAAVGNDYSDSADRFVAGIVAHFGEFQGGANESSTRGAMGRAGAENRVNALVNAVWGDWLDIMRRAGQDPYLADPSSMNLSPLRQLVVRLIQGRQGRLNNQQQHAIHNFFARAEESSVWYNNINGVIGAVNRESFGWK